MREDPINLIIGLDGITVQHVGEIVFECASTFESRRQLQNTYRHCLEDFASAILFGDNIAIAGQLPKVGNESPGQLVLDVFEGVRRNLDIFPHLTPPDLLQHPEYRERIRTDLLCLGAAITRQGHAYWNDLIIREAQTFLGQHDTLYDSKIGPETMVFARIPEYFSDQDLQKSINREEFINVFSRNLQQITNKQITIQALEEFVARIALTHFVIYWWYEAAIEEAKIRNRIRMPHVTRAVVRAEELKRAARNSNLQQETKRASRLQVENDGRLRRARELLVQHALFEALFISPKRADLFHSLLELRENQTYKEIRRLWSILIYEASEMKQKQKIDSLFDTIINDVRRLIDVPHLEPIQLDLELSRFRYSCWRTFRSLGELRSKEYPILLTRVFPELDVNLVGPSSAISFGTSNSFGDILIGDVAGRNVEKTSIISIQVEPVKNDLVNSIEILRGKVSSLVELSPSIIQLLDNLTKAKEACMTNDLKVAIEQLQAAQTILEALGNSLTNSYQYIQTLETLIEHTKNALGNQLGT